MTSIPQYMHALKTQHVNQTSESTGIILIILSAITFSTAGLFTKSVDAGAWEVIAWRALFSAVFTILWLIYRRSLKQQLLNMGYSGLLVGVIGALGTAAFIQSFKLTSIANVSLIYAIAPLLAALFGWILIREKVSRLTLFGCFGALLGVTIIVSGSLGQLSFWGDMLALCMTIVMASIMVIYRTWPSTPSAGPALLASILLFPVATLLGNPLAIDFYEIIFLSGFGLLFAIASITLAEGAKHVASGKTALLSTLETPLAPIFAFFLLAEIPGIATVIGGLIVLAAVLTSLSEHKLQNTEK